MRAPTLLLRRVALLALPAVLAAERAQASPTLVFSHAGCVDPASTGADPTLEGWTLEGLVAPGSVGAACADLGVDAWETVDADAALAGPHYRQDPTPVAAAAASGWVLRGTLRVRDPGEAPDGSVLLESSVAGSRFRLLFGSDALGNTLAVPEGSATPVVAQTRTLSATNYHSYELSFDPTAGTAGRADLYVDGLPMLLGWDATPTADSRILFGADDAAGTGAARFSQVSFETGVQACRNGIDDDGDGRIDMVLGDADPGCASPSDTSEKSPLRVCDDGIDNDGDGLVDRADPGCTSVTGRSELPGFQIVTSGLTSWTGAVGGHVLAFDTTAANVGLASELSGPPAPGAHLCGPLDVPATDCHLTYEAASTGLCRSFSVRPLEVGAGITFDDSAERNGSAVWQNALSIGDVGDYQNDDFEIDFGAGQEVRSFGFSFVDNKRDEIESLTIYGENDEVLGILPGPAAPLSDGNLSAFVGIVSPKPIKRVVFDESPDGDDLAIRDFRFGDPDSDADGLGDCAEAGVGTDPADADSDDDGLTDGAEVDTHHTNPLVADTDADGLTDGAEVDTHHTDPLVADSDADGLSDGAEVTTHGTDPLDADSDDDGLADGAEITTYGTGALDPDSDDDGLPDGVEVSSSGTNPLDADSDDDGVSDGAEVGTYGTNPLVADSDADGLADGVEILTYATNPTSGDSDADGLGDGAEVNTYATNPTLADSDADGLGDAAEINTYATNPNSADSDADGLGDGAEVDTYGTNPKSADSDGDGLGDGAEVQSHGTDPALADTDQDGLSDGAEVLVYQTNPLVRDTDGDTYSDAHELAAGTNPLDPTSFPAPAVPALGAFGRALAAALLALAGLAVHRRRALAAP